MTALRAFPLDLARRKRSPTPVIDVAMRPALNLLRMIALQCRSAARTDLFEACALLSIDGPQIEHAHAVALIKGLPSALQRRPDFYRPACTDITFDEAWIMRALWAIKQGDTDSLTFLVASRVVPMHRRHIAFLLRGISDNSTQF